MRLRRAPLALGSLLVAVLVVTACGGGRRYRPFFGWASVPACQAAIRGRALSEFGSNSKIVFDGPAEEEKSSKNQVRVTGTATLERKKKKDDILLDYECVTNPKRSRLISAQYSTRK